MKNRLTPQSFIIPVIGGAIAGYLLQNVAAGVAVFAVLLMPVWLRIYVEYAKDNPKQLWFKRKLYGWGWVPVTWQGWGVTVLYVAIIAALASTLDEQSPRNEVAFMFVLPFVLLTAAFMHIAYKKGEKPRWQWGEEKK